MVQIATADNVSREELLDFLRPRHNGIYVATRSDGRPQLSPAEVSICVLSDDFGGPWVQVYGTAEVLDMPEAAEPFVDYFRSIAGEHPDWDEYRQAMAVQGKSLIRITLTSWGPVATGGFPPEVAARMG